MLDSAEWHGAYSNGVMDGISRINDVGSWWRWFPVCERRVNG